MSNGSRCPECRGKVMSFKEFLLHAEPHKTYPCASCGVRLGRSRVVYLILALAGVGFVAATLFVVLTASQQGRSWAAMAAIGTAAGGIAGAGFTLVVKLIGYSLPLWRVAE